MSPRLTDLLLSSQSDERLVGLARAGHERAFVVIVERYRAELHAFAGRLCSDGRSEDIVQQAFLSAFTALRAGSEVRHLRGWLYQIVRNAAIRPGEPPCVALDGAIASVSSVEDVVQQRAQAMAALSALARLPSRQREAIIGTALDGRPRAEIASSMGLSEGAVRQLVHRARTTLRGAVSAVTPWPLARWIAAIGPDGPATAQVAGRVGAASTGGLVLKLGALLASGTFLTGVAVEAHSPHGHPAGARAEASGHVRTYASRPRALALASVARPAAVEFVSAPAPAAEGSVNRDWIGGHSGSGARHAPVWPDRRGTGFGPNRGRDGGWAMSSHDANRDPSANGGSSWAGGRNGRADFTAASSGSDGRGWDGGQGPDARIAGGESLGSGPQTRAGSDQGGHSQMASESHASRRGMHGLDAGRTSGD